MTPFWVDFPAMRENYSDTIFPVAGTPLTMSNGKNLDDGR
jgi:hypothetical protein